MKVPIALASLLLAIALQCAAPGHASPEDPYADDWVAMAYSPTTGSGGWGTSGTDLGANSIALSECTKNGGASDCVLTATTHLGCVAYATTAAGIWVSGQGPDEGGAIQDAANVASARPDADSFTLGGVHCSKPPA